MSTDDPVAAEPFVAGLSKIPPAPRFKEFFSSWNMELVFFQVENTVFAIPRYVLNYPGTPFEAMFTIPRDDKKDTGVDAENAVVLSEVAEDDFEALLHVLYPSAASHGAASPKFIADGFDYWVGVLRLATMWEFDKVRKQAITRLSTLLEDELPLKSIHLGKTYSVANWIQSGYVRLCSKPSLTLKELCEPEGESSSHLALDWKTIATLFYIQNRVPPTSTQTRQLCTYCETRGYARYLDSSGYCDYCGQQTTPVPQNTQSVEKLIKEHFQEELNNANVRDDDAMIDPPLPLPPSDGAKKKKGKKKL